eukprot:TRINITY_DN71313_c0_g1_i1.p1 TRINITY_DN71313_c0_g1~~TRINITY_DN71313_c0_g1_i1.p1  ORF type:complete len:295 (+),score=58.20 TRINITY_DN71313_c0_g1_i1:116-886(+)
MACAAHRRLRVFVDHIGGAASSFSGGGLDDRGALSAQRCSGGSADDRKPVCLVVGAGAGVGQAAARKFAREGFHVCCIRRGGGEGSLSGSDAKERLTAFCDALKAEGYAASPFFADGTKPEDIKAVIERVEKEVGPIHVALYNIGAQIGSRTLEKTSYRVFELSWRNGSLGAFALAKEVSPYMLKRGHGTIIYTSSTAAFRGNRGQHAHTAAMAARRALSQSVNHELAREGIHVCHVNLDGPVDAPDTLGKLMPDA